MMLSKLRAPGTLLRREVPYLTPRMNLVSASSSRIQLMNISTKNVGVKDLEKLKVNQVRLMDTLHETCAFGTGLRWGRYETHRHSL